MTDHTARPESWEEQETWCSAGNGIADCLRELRARVDRLEQAQQPESAAAEPAEPTDRMDMTLGELLRLNELWNAGEPGGRQLNLSGLDLRGADLSGTDLQDADLSGAFMRRANLTRANLRSANLHGASTRGAIGLPKPAPPAEPAPSTPHAAIEVLRDAISALRYIEQGHGRLYGVGWDRVFDAAAPFLAAEPAPSTLAGLVSDVAALIADFASTSRVGDDCTPAASEVLRKVADWHQHRGWHTAAEWLRREVGR